MKKALSVLLAMLMVLTIFPLSVFAAETTVELTAEKTAAWTDSPKNTEADIVVTASTKVTNPVETKVLLLGTLCDGHEMGKTTLVDTINIIAQKADVTYYGFSATQQSDTVTKSGTVKRYESIATDTFSLDHPKHYALKSFINTLYTELVTNKNKYDYILFEFDSARVAIDIENRVYNKDKKQYYNATDNTGNTFSGLTDKMDAIADILLPYYQTNKVIWVTDVSNINGETYSFGKVGPNNRFDQGTDAVFMKYLTKGEFKALASVMAPGDYKNFETKFSSYPTTASGAEAIKSKTLLTDIDSYVKDAPTHKTDYKDLNALKKFVSDLIEETKYEIVFNDTVKVDDGLEIVSTKLELSKDGGSTWGYYKVKNPKTGEEEVYTPVVNEKEGTVTVDVNDAFGASAKLRLTIHVRDTGTFKTSGEKDLIQGGKYTKDPNKGNAVVTVTYPDLDPIEKKATTKLPLEWEAKYKVTTTVTNGTTTTPVVYADSGENATSKSAPDEGYKLMSVKVDDEALTGNALANYKKDPNLFFENIKNNIKVEVVYGLDNVTYEYEGDLIPKGAEDILKEDEQYAEKGYPEGEEVTVAANPEITGYKFSGWHTDDAKVSDGKFDMPDNDVVLKGSWEKIPAVKVTADVEVDDVSVDGDIKDAGTELTYVAKVENTHPTGETAEKVVVTMKVPGGLENVEPNNDGTYDKETRTVTWVIPTLKKGEGEEKELTFTADIPEDITEIKTYKTKAEIPTINDEEYTGEGKTSNEVTTKGMPLIEMTVTKTWSDTWAAHTDDTVKVQLYADGEALGKPIVLTKAEQSATVSDLPKFDYATEEPVSYTFKELDSKDEAIEAGNTNGNYIVSYSTNAETNTVTVANTYQFGVDDFTITKAVSKELAKPGDEVVYTISVKNNKSYQTAESIKVKDMLPEGLLVMNVDDGACVMDTITGAYVWTIDSLDAGKTATLNITVSVPNEANNIRYTNTASIVSINGKTAEKSSDPVDTDVKTYKVTKVWLDENGVNEDAKHSSDSVSVSLIRDGDNETPYDTKTLTSEGGWTYTWYNLPLYKEGSTTEKSAYTIVENSVPDGFTVSYADAGKDSSKVVNTRGKVKVNYVFVGEEQPEKASDILPGEDTLGYGAEYTSSSVETIKNSPVIKGYTFAGWYNEEKCETSYVDGTNIYEDTTLYGLFTRNKVTVGFEYKGNVPEGEKAPEDKELNQYDTIDPEEPSATGYEFVDWFKDEECKEPWDPTEEVGEDTTIYGLWEAIPSFEIVADVKKDGESVDKKTVPAGSNLVYETTVENTNEGNAPLYDVVVSINVPEGLEEIVPNDDGVYNPEKRTITWTLETLKAGEDFAPTLTYNAKVPEDLTEIETYIATAKVESVDEVPYTEPDGTSNTLNTKAMPLVTRTVTKTWSDTWENHKSDAIKVQLYANDTEYGSAFTLNYAEQSKTIASLPKYDEDGELITYTFKEILADGSAVENGGMTGKYKVSYKDGEATDSKIISNDYQIDKDDLSIVKSVSNALAEPGSDFTYTVKVTNDREYETAYNVVVEDIIPKELTIKSVSGASCVQDKSKVTWTISSIAPKDTAELTITVTVPEEINKKRFENTANIISVDGTSQEKDSNTVVTDVKTFTVKKFWMDEKGNDESAKHEGDTLSISLLRDGTVIDTVTINKDNKWTYTWKGLPLYKDGTTTESVYMLVENNLPEGFYIDDSYPDYNTGVIKNIRKAVNVQYYFVGDEQPDKASTILPVKETLGYGFEYTSSPEKAIQDNPITRGYTFAGWYVDSSCKVPYVDGTAIIKDTDLYGLFTRNKINLDFEYKGDVPPDRVPPEDRILNQYDTFDPAPLTPERAGYEFHGWFKDEECKEPWDPAVELEKDTTIYGLWEVIESVGISADVQKDGVSVNNKTVPAGSTLTYVVDVENTNVGGATMEDVIVSINVPEGLINIEPKNDGVYDPKTRTITWNIPALLAGEENIKELTYDALVPEDITEIETYVAKAGIDSVHGKEYKKDNKYSETLTTKAMPLVTATVTKRWSDTWLEHEGVSVQLYANAAKYGESITLTQGKKTVTVKDLDKFDDEGKLIAYTFKELDADGAALENGAMVGKYKVEYSKGEEENSTVIKNNYQIDKDDLTLTKAVDKANAKPGDTVVYTISVKNNRAYETAKNVVIKDIIPAGLEVKSVDGANCTKDATGAYIWNIASIAPSTTVVLKVTTVVSDSTNNVRLENTAKLISIDGKPQEKDSNTVITDVKTFNVIKVWLDEKGNDESAKHETDSITVRLFRDGVAYDAVVLDKTNGWKFTWNSLPLFIDGTETKSEYTILEIDGPEGFNVEHLVGENTNGTIFNKRKEVKVTYHFVGEEKPANVNTLLPASETLGYGFEYTSSSVDLIKNNPITKGYTFAGWYIDEDCKTPYVDGTSIIKDTDLYGLFTRNKIKLDFEYKGDVPPGRIPPEDRTLNQFDTFDPKPLTPEKAGYEFKGWFKDAECKEPWDPTVELEKDTTIYGLWKRINATLHYDANGGKNAPDDQTLTYEDRAYISKKTPTRKGYKFMGWSNDPKSKVVDYEPKDLFKKGNVVPKDKTLYAVWKRVNTDRIIIDGKDEKKEENPNTGAPLMQTSAALVSAIAWMF